MKALLINPSKYDADGKLEKYRWGGLPPLNLLIVAALLQEQGVEVEVVDEYVQDIPFERDVDLVGVTTTFTCTFPRVVDICKQFRNRGIRVILGGTHATCMQREVQQHCDAVVQGEAEGKVAQLVADLRETGSLKPLYGDGTFIDLEHEPYRRPPYELLDMRAYIRLGLVRKSNLFAIESSRGCPMPCTFCCIGFTHGKTPRARSIAAVIQEIRDLKNTYGASFFAFADDNFSMDRERCLELCKALAGERIRFYCELPTTILHQPDLVEALARAGCVSALLGMESTNEANLRDVSKGFNHPDLYRDLFELLAAHRISAMAAMIFGFDHDTPDVFRNTVDFLKTCRVPRALFTILTPVPGTRLYDRLQQEGRIINPNFTLYDGTHAVFQPQNMTPQELERGFWEAYRSFYDLPSICRRTLRSGLNSAFYTLFSNLRFRRLVRQELYPYNSGIERLE